MNRQHAFESFADHALLGALWRKLRSEELELCREYLRAHEERDWDEFAESVSRMFLDKPDRPKHASHIQELLSCANSVARREARGG